MPVRETAFLIAFFTLIAVVVMAKWDTGAAAIPTPTPAGQGTPATAGAAATTTSPAAQGAAAGTSTPALQIGRRTKTSGCISRNSLPDPACTPGAVFPDATAKQICVPGYSSSVRDVSTFTKDRVYAEYGIRSHSPGEYEVDHLISLELGGSNAIANLWPEPAEPRPGFHEKDQVENYLHDQICSGAMALTVAQTKIANNWLAVFNEIPK